MTLSYDDIDQSPLARIKDNIATSYLYFKDNYNRYRQFRTYVFRESITDMQRTLLKKKNWPEVEFNILEAYISRLLGEFAHQEPSINVSPAEGVPVDQAVIDTVEGYFRHILHEADKSQFSYEVYKDLLSGGFSVGRVRTDYSSPMSFKQEIYIDKCFDPTLCGFDPIARNPSKDDGHFCFEIFPMTEADFKEEYPDVATSEIKFGQDVEGFSWAYKDIQQNKIVLVVDYYEKKRKKTRIVQLSDGTVMTAKRYKKLQQYWIDNQIIAQIPLVISKRTTILETVCRYKLIQNKILSYEETDYSYLPMVFIDGNSIFLAHGKNNNTYQMTRPLVYHAKGVQELKNFAGQCLANHLQNIVQSKFIVKREAIPQQADSLEALTNIQRANTIIINAYNENDPSQPIPDPITPVMTPGAPPEVMAAFQVTDPTTQAILGSFASNLAQNNADLSGKAVVETLSADNASSMPYISGYLAGLTQIANICVDLMPKYILGERTIPVINKRQEKYYQDVNMPGAPELSYAERALKVNVDAGVNFQVQKNQAVQQIIALMQASEELSKFFNSEKGLKILSKNLTIYQGDSLPEAIDEFMQQQQQQQQQMMQQQQQMMQFNPEFIKAQAEMMNAETKREQMQVENELQIAKLAIEEKLADAKMLEAEAKVTNEQIATAVKLEEVQTSQANHALDAAAKMAEVRERELSHHIKLKELEQGANHADT